MVRRTRLNMLRIFVILAFSCYAFRLLGTSGDTVRVKAHPASENVEKRLIDVILFDSELDMLHYRLRLHKDFVDEFVIVESNITFSGKPKKLRAEENLTDSLGDASYKVTLLNVPLDGTVGAWERGHSVRAYIVKWLSKRARDKVVLVSDVDELIDPSAVQLVDFATLDCIRPKLRFYYYCLRCSLGYWSKQSLFRTDGKWFSKMLQAETYEDIRGQCTETPELMGWHVSYAFSTSKIITKMESFSHHGDSFVKELLENPDREGLIDDRVRNCEDVYGRARAAIAHVPLLDVQIPKVDGMPAHEQCRR